MPRKKSRVHKVHEMIDTKTEDLLPIQTTLPKRKFPLTRVAIGVVVIGLIALFLSNKGLLVAAVVDGKPIFRWQLTKVLTDRYGTQTLDSLISQTLVNQEAQKANVTVFDTEIQTKEAELVKSLGGNVSLDDVLKYQGMTKSDFEEQLRLQLLVEKLLGKDITITDADITAYIATNAAMLSATDEAGLRAEAKQAIFSQEINKKLQTWFSGIKEKAKILRFL